MLLCYRLRSDSSRQGAGKDVARRDKLQVGTPLGLASSDTERLNPTWSWVTLIDHSIWAAEAYTGGPATQKGNLLLAKNLVKTAVLLA